MATAIPITSRAGWRTRIIEFLGAAGVAATDTGDWVDVSDLENMTIDVYGITTATVQVRGFNTISKPLASADGRLIGSNITTDKMVAIHPMKWVKIKVSAWTTGTIIANLFGQEKYRG